MAGAIEVNRAPVLTLWATVVAERAGYDRQAALTLGKAVAGLNAQAKGRTLGIYKKAEQAEGAPPPKKSGSGEELRIEVCGRPVPAKKTKDGIRAVSGDEALDPASVDRYLRGKFGEHLEAVEQAMQSVARSYAPDELNRTAFAIYEQFRPEIASGTRGWGQKGELSLARITRQAKKPPARTTVDRG